MKVVSFNVNSVRMRTHQLAALINKYQPDIIGLQETKVQDHEFPTEVINSLGYHAVFTGQKTHYGVALLSKKPLSEVELRFPNAEPDAQTRFIKGVFSSPKFGEVTVINGYFPQGESRQHPTKFANKKGFYADLLSYLKQNVTPGSPIVVMGDMNIAPLDNDIGIGEDNKKRWLSTEKCSFLPEEREWMDKLYQWGLTDTISHHTIEGDKRYSWFDYRSKGFEQSPKRGLRIDHVLANDSLSKYCDQLVIDHEFRAMDKPSDHCPIIANFRP